MKIVKWGNSLAVRLPAEFVRAYDLKEGDDVEIGIAGGRQLDLRSKPDRQALLARLRKYRGRIPIDFKFDRLEANRRG